MDKALDAVTCSHMSIRRAAAEYNVRRSTLADHVNGGVKQGTVSGPKYCRGGGVG